MDSGFQENQEEEEVLIEQYFKEVAIRMGAPRREVKTAQKGGEVPVSESRKRARYDEEQEGQGGGRYNPALEKGLQILCSDDVEAVKQKIEIAR